MASPRSHDTFKLVSPHRFGDADQPWREVGKSDAEINPVRSMIDSDESRFLHWCARETFTGTGKIVDMGPLAGGSTYALASGLVDNRRAVDARDVIRSYDMWEFLSRPSVVLPR